MGGCDLELRAARVGLRPDFRVFFLLVGFVAISGIYENLKNRDVVNPPICT